MGEKADFILIMNLFQVQNIKYIILYIKSIRDGNKMETVETVTNDNVIGVY